MILDNLPNLIVIAYFLLPPVLVYAIYKGRDVPFHWMFLVFGVFLSICGTAYVIQTWQIWYPNTWISEFLKILTVIVGIAIAFMVLALLPVALALPSPARLEATKLALESEICDRLRAEKALCDLASQLEQKVEQRTAELSDVNFALKREISDRLFAEKSLRQSETQLRTEHQQLQAALRELQHTQSQLIQAEKMSSLGQMVAGIAHEVNNPVSFIFSNLHYAKQYTGDLLHLVDLYQQEYPQPSGQIQNFIHKIELDFIREDLLNLLSSMRVGTERIRQIVLSMRNFSRLHEAEMKPVDIHEGIDNTLLILNHRLKAVGNHTAIQVIKEYSSLPLVECYAGQLNQVFMNILSNAIDALRELEAHKFEQKQRRVQNTLSIRIQTQVLADNCVNIRIADNGIGIAENLKQKLFDPFFTTKPVGKGTGLGLSICYQIVVDKHRGQLRCVSASGQGAEFVIKIPIRQSPVEQAL
ncbi:histidine kinase [Cylindrospermum stagnale PCC 7417]|uniref:histidine kinase n=1 Tax=Cylindrospermum stagnale PCC 7417 TaxID=56107 RepID=K9WVM6_9NOST|nr:ATP-binding protein [Cylindrospermum stagnale]AFZ24258.1 histidine kinase [Cylindrospermum stagnale PCC 7417]